MSLAPPSLASPPDAQASRVLGKAVLRAADAMGITHRHLAEIIGVSEATVSRLKSQRATVAPGSKAGQLALLFLRVFRSIDALVGGNEASLRAWLASQNHHVRGVPAELLRKPEGLVHVADYLDAMRGKL